MGPIGVQEMIAIFVIALLLFGPKKLPELGRTLGKALSEFRRAKNELKSTFETHMQELERETRIDSYDYSRSLRSANTTYSPAQYSYPYDEYGRYDSAYESTAQPVNGISTSETPQEATGAATTPWDAGEQRDHSSPPAPPVEDTIARSNGVRPVEPVPAPAPEEHLA